MQIHNFKLAEKSFYFITLFIIIWEVCVLQMHRWSATRANMPTQDGKY